MMHSTARFLFLWSAVTVAAFVPTTTTVTSFSQRYKSTVVTSLQMSSSSPISNDSDTASSSSNNDPPIVVNGQNIELTPALTDYVKKRIGTPIHKLAGSNNSAIQECDVVLCVTKNPKVKNGHRVEVVTSVKGTTIICKHSSPDMYTAIDAVAHALTRKLRQYKERRTQGWHGNNGNSAAHMGDEDLNQVLESLADTYQDIDIDNSDSDTNDNEDFDEYSDPEAPVITKIKSFDLEKPISLREAVFSLDYIDLDFYVFKNEETDKVSVVFKRTGGGIGLIEP